MPVPNDERLFKGLLAAMLILAAIILYYGGRRYFAGFSHSRPVAAGEGRGEGGHPAAHRAPAQLPPMKLLRIEGKRTPSPAMPPIRPKPDLVPDRE